MLSGNCWQNGESVQNENGNGPHVDNHSYNARGRGGKPGSLLHLRWVDIPSHAPQSNPRDNLTHRQILFWPMYLLWHPNLASTVSIFLSLHIWISGVGILLKCWHAFWSLRRSSLSRASLRWKSKKFSYYMVVCEILAKIDHNKRLSTPITVTIQVPVLPHKAVD